MGKGSNYERELVNKLWEQGYAVMRSPSSGGGRKHPQPDILYSNGRYTVALECKSSSKERIYIDKRELEQLYHFCKRWKAIGLIALRFNYLDWIFLEPAYLSDVGKNLKIDKKTAVESGQKLSSIISR